MSETGSLSTNCEFIDTDVSATLKKRKRKACEEDGCNTNARGGFKVCFKHGGCKRCTEPGCNNGAQGATEFCKGHGGGRRCTEPGCNTSARGATEFCIEHGGGKRCADPVCNKSAVGTTNFCIGHDGGKRCIEPGCDNGARGGFDFCVGHDGGIRCKHGRIKLQCTDCPINEIVPKSICKGCLSKLLSHKRRETGICAECDKTLPERTEITFGQLIIDQVGFEPTSKDKIVASGPACKGLDKRRPDLLWVVHGQVAVVVEIDELSHISGYEPSCEVAKITEQNYAIQMSDGCKMIPVYTIRVNPDSYDVKKVQKKTRAKMVANKVKELLKGEYEPNGYAKVFFCCYHTSSNHLIEKHKKNFPWEIM